VMDMAEPLKMEIEQGCKGGDPVDIEARGKNKGTVFILVGHYLPGFRGGGPTRSIANLVSSLGQEFSFKVITLDRDLGDTMPYSGVAVNRWIRTGNADVMYLSPGWRGLLRMIVLLRSLDLGTVLYLNSFFNKRFSILAILLRRVCLIHPRRIVLAPRGEFSPGALQIKSTRKAAYITLARWLGFYRNVTWHASSHLEMADVQDLFGRQATVGIAVDLPQPRTDQEVSAISGRFSARTHGVKVAGRLRVVFVSRISPKKNLLAALRVLKGVSGDVAFDIYGPAEDAEYWNECKDVIETLPANVRVKYLGEVEHDKISEVFAKYDLLLLPTLGENYGHVICEALAAACPVLISDRTPWLGLQGIGVGWDVPLEDMQRFTAILQECVDAEGESYNRLRMRAKEYAEGLAANPSLVDANRRLFKAMTND